MYAIPRNGDPASVIALTRSARYVLALGGRVFAGRATSSLSREERMVRNRAKKLRQGQEAIAGLMTHWPQLFGLEQLKPLKIGMAADILDDIKARELDLTRAKANAALMFYTQTPAYQQAVHASGSRFDLSGQPCGEITGQQQAHALKQLKKWRTALDAAASSP